MIKLIETVCKRIGPSSLRSYLENKINRIYALVGEDPEFKFQAYDFEDKSSKSTEAGDAIEDTQSDAGGDSFALDLKLLELAFECERQTAIFEGFKTLGGSVGKQQTSKEKQLDDQLGAALRKIEKLSAKVAEGEAREKDLRDQLKAARASGGGRGDGGKSYGGGNWYGSKHGGGRGYGRGGEKNRGAKPTASAVLYQRAADGTYYVVEGTYQYRARARPVALRSRKSRRSHSHGILGAVGPTESSRSRWGCLRAASPTMSSENVKLVQSGRS
jgi:hypothetical protein